MDPNLEVFLSQVENFLKRHKISLRYSNLSQKEWRAIRSLVEDISILIK